MEQNRRDFMIAASMAAMGLAVAPKLRFPAVARDRLAVASYSFRSLIDTPRNREKSPAARLIALRDFAEVVAQRYGVRNVELLGAHFPSTELAYLSEVRDAVKAAGSHIVNLPISVGASMYDPDADKRRTAVVNAKLWVDRATALDCPSIRVHIQGLKGAELSAQPSLDLIASCMREVAGYGESKGVLVNLENDDLLSEDAFLIAKIVDRVNSAWLRALPDFCNSMLKGDAKFNYDAVETLFARAYNISHAKDSEVANGKLVRVDLARTFAIAKKSGFKGYFSIEWEGEGDVWVENGRLIDQSLDALSS